MTYKNTKKKKKNGNLFYTICDMFSITWSFYTNVRLKATEKKNGLVGACTLC